jgi:hypothetical protein
MVTRTVGCGSLRHFGFRIAAILASSTRIDANHRSHGGAPMASDSKRAAGDADGSRLCFAESCCAALS